MIEYDQEVHFKNRINEHGNFNYEIAKLALNQL